MGWFGVHLHNNTLKHRFGLRPTLDAQCYARLCICFANYCTNQLHIVRRLAQRYVPLVLLSYLFCNVEGEAGVPLKF